MAAFDLSFTVRKKNQKKKVSGDITTRVFVLPAKFTEFYYPKIVDDNLNVCMDKHTAIGLSITGDIKNYQCHMIKRA